MKSLITAAVVAIASLGATSASATQVYVQDGIQLNARSGPGAYYHVLGKFHACTPVHVVHLKHGWAKVAYNHNYYWVAAKYLQTHKCGWKPKHKKHYNNHYYYNDHHNNHYNKHYKNKHNNYYYGHGY